MLMFVWLISAGLLLVDGQSVRDICQVLSKPSGDKLRVNCTQADIVSLSGLDIPVETTQLSIIGSSGLTAIGKDDLLSLTNLDKLNLSRNSISSIADNAFRDLAKVTKLDLSNNRLTSINSSTFAGLRNLKKLSLSGNLLETLPQAAFDPLPLLTRLDFVSDNLVCDCRLKWIVQWIIDKGVNVADTACTAPSNMKDTLVKNLNRDNLQCGWPVNLERFELVPSKPMLAFGGDNLPLKCVASIERLRGLYWYRQGLRVVSNATARVSVENRTDPSTVTLTLRLNEVAADKSGTWTCAAVTDHGNVTKSISIVVAPAFCPQVTNVTKKGTYSWSRAGYNSRAEQKCAANEAKAFHSCNDKGQWVNLDLEACKYTRQITQGLSDLSMADFNVTTNLDLVKTLMESLSQPTDCIVDMMDVVFVSRVLRKISSSYDLYSKAEIPQMVYNITSLMMNINSSLLLEAEKEEKACTILRDNLQTVVNYVLESTNKFDLHMSNIALESFKLDPRDSFDGLVCSAHDNLKGNKTYRHSNFFCTMQAPNADSTPIKQTVEAMIRIPPEVTSFASSQRAVKLVVIIYRNDSLFQLKTPVSKQKEFVPSSVISANIIGASVNVLVKPVVIALKRQDYAAMVPNVHAVYWHPVESTWKTNGCWITNTVEQKYHNLSMVECDHMASFALLQEEPMVLTTTQPPPLAYFVHKPQFYVGAAFLCVCLLAVIITYLVSYRTINASTKLKHSLINTCLSILLLKVIFILGVKTHHIECKIVGMAIHYFSITTIFWITVSTWNIYRKVSSRAHRPMPTEDGSTPLPPNPMLKFYLFAWGVPVIVCGITGAVNINLSETVNPAYCFIDWDPGKAAFFVVVGLCAISNLFLYICICTSKSEGRAKVFTDEMTVLNADGLLEPQAIDDSMSMTGSVKSSIADGEYRPLAQLAGIVTFTLLYMLMWASAAVSVVLPVHQFTQQLDVILSFLYMILCIILGIFLVAFYCLARNDTRATWHTCCKASNNATSQHPRSNTNINVISHANAHNSLKRDEDGSCSSLQTSSLHNQSNPLMQFMQYHKKAATTHSVACSHSKGDASAHGSPDDAPVFFNPRQNGVAKRYWERRSRERGMNGSMMSVPESSRLHAHSPTNTEPLHHMSIEVQIKSHGSKQAKRHRLGSTNSEPADVRNNIYHSMPKSHHLHTSIASQNKRREPTIGQSRTPSEGAPDNKQFYGQSSPMWQSSVPRNFHHRAQLSPHDNEHMCLAFDTTQNKQPYTHGYLRSMKDTDNSDDDDSHFSHRSKRSSQRSRHRHHRPRQQTHDGECERLTPSALVESRASLQSHSTARSHHSSRSTRSAHKQRMPRTSGEERPLLQQAPQPTHKEVDEDKLNINHSSSDNNSSHYACTPVPEAQKISNIPNIAADGGEVVYSVPQQNLAMLKVDVSGVELSALEMCIPEEGIYENARNVVQHERPVYANLEEIRKQAIAAQALKSLEPPASEYELPVYENLFSLNEYDTLRKQKHHATKGLLSNKAASSRDIKSPVSGAHEDSSL